MKAHIWQTPPGEQCMKLLRPTSGRRYLPYLLQNLNLAHTTSHQPLGVSALVVHGAPLMPPTPFQKLLFYGYSPAFGSVSKSIATYIVHSTMHKDHLILTIYIIPPQREITRLVLILVVKATRIMTSRGEPRAASNNCLACSTVRVRAPHIAQHEEE